MPDLTEILYYRIWIPILHLSKAWTLAAEDLFVALDTRQVFAHLLVADLWNELVPAFLEGALRQIVGRRAHAATDAQLTIRRDMEGMPPRTTGKEIIRFRKVRGPNIAVPEVLHSLRVGKVQADHRIRTQAQITDIPQAVQARIAESSCALRVMIIDLTLY